MTSRRVFLSGSAASLLAVPALPFARQALAQQALSRAPQPSSPLTRELHRQVRQGIRKLLDGNAHGAPQLAATLRIYAASIPDLRGDLREVVRRRGRAAIMRLPHDRKEVEKLADELGLPRHYLPPHSAHGLAGREKALDRLLAEGHAPLMLRAAEEIELFGVALASARPGAGVRVVKVASARCWSCDNICGLIDDLENTMALVCALAAAFPPLAELCVAVGLSFGSAVTACAVCEAAKALFC